MPNLTLSDFTTRLNLQYGIGRWPKTQRVPPELFGEICVALFDLKMKTKDFKEVGKGLYQIEILIGLNGGVMFRNLEILIEPPTIEVIG